MSIRTLSKSDFKLARTCDAKLYFRENGYPDVREGNLYLALLAEGGYMVEALAKARHEDGVQLEYGGDVHAAFAETLEHLRRENVTLFEATVLVGRRLARIDILEKRGNAIRLIEVKAKSFDSEEHATSLATGKGGVFRSSRRPYGLLSEWREKIEDVAFQTLLLEQLLPGVTIAPYLALVDKSKSSALDNIPELFALAQRVGRDGTTRLHSAHFAGTRDQLAALDFVTEVDVSEEVALIRDEVADAAATFEARLDEPLAVHVAGIQRDARCRDCEFRVGPEEQHSGFRDCWGELAAPAPHVLELYHVGRASGPDGTPLIDWMLTQRKASLIEVPTEGLVRRDGTVGAVAERQRRQIEYTRRGEVYVRPELRAKIDALRGPLHFVDFEASRLALPYHAGMRPYGLVAFQWSCHTVDALGGRPVHVEWLNSTDVWPNQSFAESLRAAVGDNGPVLTWSRYEATTLKGIVADLERFGRDAPELVAWMEDVVNYRIVDLHQWVQTDYFDPGMGGRTSIKFVLDAVWRADAELRHQFEEWTGLMADAAADPYASLPSIEIAGVPQDVHEGTGAMRAYQEMMYGAEKHDPDVREQWARLLRQYCALDTLSMVLILNHWRRMTGAA